MIIKLLASSSCGTEFSFGRWWNYGPNDQMGTSFSRCSISSFRSVSFPETGGVIPPDTYAMLFTLHGTIMIFYAITPILIGCFGNFCIPLMIGARDMAFPSANMLSFWVAVLSGAVLLASLFTPLGAAAGGWTSYPTLSTLIGSPGVGQTLLDSRYFYPWCIFNNGCN